MSETSSPDAAASACPPLKTTMARVRGLGAAGGFAPWWGLRLSAVALFPLTAWLLVSLTCLAAKGASAAEVAAFLHTPLSSVLLLLTLPFALYHGARGVQEILEDYVHAEGLKIASVAAVKGVAIVLAVAAMVAVLKLALA